MTKIFLKNKMIMFYNKHVSVNFNQLAFYIKNVVHLLNNHKIGMQYNILPKGYHYLKSTVKRHPYIQYIISNE